MPELVTLGPWLRRFLCRTHRHRAQSGPEHPHELSRHLQPAAALRQPQAAQARGPAGRARSHVRAGAAVPRASRGRSRLLRPDPQSAACRHPGVRPLRRQPGSGPCRMVRPHPGHRVEEIHAAAGRMADQGGNGGHARRARPQDQAGPQRIRASALPLQHRGAGLRSDAAEGARSADRARQRRSRSCRPCTERAAGRASVRCGRKPNAFWPTRSSVARAMTPCSSAGSERRLPASGSIALSSVARPGCRNWPDRTITPHVIRHTTACHLVLAGVDINTIRAWLGHVSISTTNIYAEIDLTLKANAVALCEVGQPRPGRSWKEDKDLMAFLKSL